MADLVEARVRKRFGKRWYTGTVTEIWRSSAKDGNELLAHIAYDDGDAEDILVEDARALVVVKPEAPAAAQRAQAAPATEPAPAPKPAKRKGTGLLTDVFTRLPPKRSAGAAGPDARCAARCAAPGRRACAQASNSILR